MGVFFAAHADRAARIDVVEARFLDDFFARLDQFDLAFNFVFEGLLDEAEGVDVLDFGFGPEFGRAAETDRHVGIAAELAFLHIAIGDANVLQYLFDFGEIRIGVLGRAHVGLADNFDERRAGAIQVDVRVAV